MKKTILLAFVMMPFIMGCNQRKISGLSREEAVEWYGQTDWAELPMKMDASSDIVKFAQQNMLSPEAWKAAYDFMAKSDFGSLEEGRYELTADGVFATVTDYTTKDSAHFEAHAKYIDIQYVSSGTEYIELSGSEDRDMVAQYSEKNDIEFFDAVTSAKVLADSSNFIVLFPGEAHKPCMKIGESGPVRKIVVKIPYSPVR